MTNTPVAISIVMVPLVRTKTVGGDKWSVCC